MYSGRKYFIGTLLIRNSILRRPTSDIDAPHLRFGDTMTPKSPMDNLKQRMDALRARTPSAATEPSRYSYVPRVQTDADADAPPPGYTRIPTEDYGPPSPKNDDEAHEHIERALDQLERMSASVPGVKRVLDLIERGADGRVTTTSFARAAHALQMVSSAVTQGAGDGSRVQSTPPPALRVDKNTTFGSAEKSPRIVSPSGIGRRSSSPIGPARRVRIDSDGTEVEVPSSVSASPSASPSAPPMQSFAHEETNAEEAGARLREWSEHVRQSKRTTEMQDVAHRIREDFICQWRAFLVSNATPSDPFVAALAEQWLNEARDKEAMLTGVTRARQMIEALAESDKIKTRAIDVLCDALDAAGVQIPELPQSGIEWSDEALNSKEGVFPDEDAA